MTHWKGHRSSDKFYVSDSMTPSSMTSSMSLPFTHHQLELLEATHRALHKFLPRHHDEMEIEIGDPIYVQKEAEDLWCEGESTEPLSQRLGSLRPPKYKTEHKQKTKECKKSPSSADCDQFKLHGDIYCYWIRVLRTLPINQLKEHFLLQLVAEVLK